MHRTHSYDAAIVAIALATAPQMLQGQVPAGAAVPCPSSQIGSENKPYFDFQVEKQVAPYAGIVLPKYPESLRSTKVEGEVLAQFVVDIAGCVDMGTFKVLRETHPLFTDAVKKALPLMRFTPAEVGGKKVRQLVQMPFQFSLLKEKLGKPLSLRRSRPSPS